MKMEIMPMFAVKTQEELGKYIELFNPEQKALAYQIYAMTWNMIAKKLNEEKE